MANKNVAIAGTINETIKEENMTVNGFKFIGVGAAGNKAVLFLVDTGLVTKESVLLINSTKKDVPEDYSGAYLGLSNNGCGKERSVAKEYAVQTMKSGALEQYIDKAVDSVIIICSVGGGTGSGASPIIGEYCNKVLGKHTHFIVFTGFEEDARELQNSVDFFNELNFDCDVQCIKNSLFLQASLGNKFRAEKLANVELAEKIQVMLGVDMIASEQNIDDTDMYKIINTTGYKTCERFEVTENLVDIESFNKICKQMIYNSKSLKSNEPGQIRMGVILNLAPESEDAVDFGFSVLKDAYGVPYECFIHKQWNGKTQFISFICSGMKLPIDEIKEIHNNYLELTSKVDKENDSFFQELDKLDKGEADKNKFDMVHRGKGGKNTTTSADFFKQFETKPSK